MNITVWQHDSSDQQWPYSGVETSQKQTKTAHYALAGVMERSILHLFWSYFDFCQYLKWVIF